MNDKKSLAFIIVIILLTSTIFISANSGSIKASVSELLVGIFNKKYANVNAIIDVRFPRIIITILVGAALGVSGLLLQTVLKNPLVDPSLIGVSSGANLFLYLGIGLFPQALIFKSIFSIIGGIIGFILIYYLAGKTKNNVKIILIGIAISYFFSGISSSIQYLNQSNSTTSTAFKTVALGTKNWDDVSLLFRWLPILLIISWLLAKLCNIFALDDNIITSLGININYIRLLISFIAVALASITTAVSGVLVFLALIVPHIAKIIIGRNHIYTIPFSALLGAFVFLLFDTLGRLVFSPIEIPADLIMMVIGGPAFIILVKNHPLDNFFNLKYGCGKSTLIKLLAKNLNYNSGSIKLENKELSSYNLRELASKLSIVYQKNEIPKEITVNDMVSFARLPYQNIFFYKKSKEDKEKVDFALKHTNLTEYKDKYVSELSGGQLQRVYIAMCLAQSTDIIILDEPTTFLDIKYQKSIMKLIKHLNNTLGITIIMVLHDINQALTYSDYIVGLLNGEVVKNESADKFYDEKLLNKLYDADIKIEDKKIISW